MLVSMVMICNPGRGKPPGVGMDADREHFALRRQLAVTRAADVGGCAVHEHRNLYDVVFMPRLGAALSMATMTDIGASSVEVYRVDHL